MLYKDFGKFAERVSDRVKAPAQAYAECHGRPYEYLESSSTSKEDVARQIAARDGVRQGLVCVRSCVEPCQTYALHKNRQTKHLELAPARRKCLFLYS